MWRLQNSKAYIFNEVLRTSIIKSSGFLHLSNLLDKTISGQVRAELVLWMILELNKDVCLETDYQQTVFHFPAKYR